MKTTILALMLVLTGLELWAQQPPAKSGAAARRIPRYGNTNGVPVTPPRYQPSTQGTPAAQGTQTTPGAAGVPGGTPGGTPGALPPAGQAAPSSASAAAGTASPPEEMIAPGEINFEGVDLNEVLLIYAKYVNRTLLRAALPQAQIILKTQTPLTRTEVIQALQAVLALNGVSLVNIGDKFVKVLPSEQAGTAGGELDRSGSTNLPNLGSYVTHVVQLKYVKPSEMTPVIQPFSKLASSILAIDGNGILVLRDYAENVKRMLEMIEQVDVSVPAEYISEVIPIRYSKVEEIAGALSALGGSGSGATVSIGSSPGSSQISGVAPNRMGGMMGMGGMSGGIGGAGGYQGGGIGGGIGGGAFGGQGRTFGGQTTPNGTPSGGSQTFAQRLQNIVGATGGGGGAAGGKQDQIQLFGQTKIIPNNSSSSLLVYATRADMEVIKGIIAKLDVPLAQVLIEAVIIDVTLGNTFNLGVSAAQNPVQNGKFIGGGGMNNGQSFMSFLAGATKFSTNTSSSTTGSGSNTVTTIINNIVSTVTSAGANVGTNGSFGNSLPGGLSYFGNIGPVWDVAVQAAQSDSRASIIQRPRIQTSQAKPAQFFVGETKPYVTSTYAGYSGGYGGSSYSQLSVGVELDVTPFINPDGLVVMDIMQEIDDFAGTTHIDNVGDIPNTIKRTLNAEIAVRDRDTIMLGGFIKSNKNHTQSGVPFLSNIPLLGNLFKQQSDNKDREELIVLMRPTVLQTPELAAKHTVTEEQRLPAVSGAAAEDAAYERTLIDAQRKREQKKYKQTRQYDGFFVPPPEVLGTNSMKAPADSAAPQTGSYLPAQPVADEEDVHTVQQAVHPQAGVVPPPSTPAAPAGDSAAPPTDPAAQQKAAAAALAQKMMELNSPKPVTPPAAPH